MRRREMVTGFAGAALFGSTAWAQTSGRQKTVGVLTGTHEDNPDIPPGIKNLRQALLSRGWREGENLQVIYRFAAGDPGRVQMFATEFARLQPDVIVAHTAIAVAALQRATPMLPIVFVSIPGPVADGFVASFSRPGVNLTGFTNYDFTLGAKWLEILTEVAPGTQRVAVLLNTDAQSSYASYAGYWRSVEAGARAISISARLASVHNRQEIESAITALAAEPGGGLIV